MRNWIVLGLMFGMCLTCVGQVEARKKPSSKKTTVSKKSDKKASETTTKTATEKQASIAGNIAKGKPVIVSSTEEGNGNVASNATDGDTSTRWSSAYSDPQWIRVDLGGIYDIKKVVLSWDPAYAKYYEIQVSNNDSDWKTIYTKTDGMGGTEEITLSGSGRYVRMYGTERGSQWGYSLWEFEVYCK